MPRKITLADERFFFILLYIHLQSLYNEDKFDLIATS